MWSGIFRHGTSAQIMNSRSAAQFAVRHWYRISPLSVLLAPLSWLFRIAVAARRTGYRAGLFKATKLDVPVIVVGNLVVGGTGKTPLVAWMACWLKDHGYRPGIILRGYGASAPSPRQAIPGDSPAVVGDEALLLAESTRCPVWIGRDRAAAGAALLNSHPECNVLVSDDGLQHYGLKRDLEIAVEDARGYGNGMMLPAGPLREPASRRVDATVVNGLAAGPHDDANRGVMFSMQVRPVGLFSLDGRVVPIDELRGLKLHAVAGTGNPERFFVSLRELGLQFIAHEFPDHHSFVPAELLFEHCDRVIMTEKDAVKCRSFQRSDFVTLRVIAEPEAAFGEFLLKAVHGLPSA
jgi:tetraacyldisaccharide 4'-kinase